MNGIAMKSIDKTKWSRGPWDAEKDVENFKTAAGLDASIIRVSHSGALCGYVGVPASHPWHGKEYGDSVAPSVEQLSAPVEVEKVSVISLFVSAASGDDPAEGARIDCLMRVHGGLTYSGAGRAGYGENPDLWYFGFDCAHYGDHCPAMDSLFMDGEYRDVEYVRSEIETLASQLAGVAP